MIKIEERESTSKMGNLNENTATYSLTTENYDKEKMFQSVTLFLSHLPFSISLVSIGNEQQLYNDPYYSTYNYKIQLKFAMFRPKSCDKLGKFAILSSSFLRIK